MTLRVIHLLLHLGIPLISLIHYKYKVRGCSENKKSWIVNLLWVTMATKDDLYHAILRILKMLWFSLFYLNFYIDIGLENMNTFKYIFKGMNSFHEIFCSFFKRFVVWILQNKPFVELLQKAGKCLYVTFRLQHLCSVCVKSFG